MTAEESPDDLLTLVQVSAMVGIDTSRLRRLAAQGVLRAQKLGKTWITTRRDVETFSRLPRPPGWQRGRPRQS